MLRRQIRGSNLPSSPADDTGRSRMTQGVSVDRDLVMIQ